jgi:hypothetical protein
LKKQFLGDVTLQARYIRGAFDDKPFTIGKYENTRIRSAIAELAANGGAPMGFYTRFSDPLARKEIVRYYQFLKRYDDLYRANRPYAEVVLIFPRSQVHAGHIEPLESFRKLGKRLLESHILFDVIPDDLATKERLAQYTFVVRSEQPDKCPTADNPKLSRFEAPFTVRISANRPAKGNDVSIHFVNYNRTEPKRARDGRPSAGGGIKDEKSISVSGIRADVVIPNGYRVAKVQVATPEEPAATPTAFTQKANRVQFKMPEFLVYAVANIQLEPIKN